MAFGVAKHQRESRVAPIATTYISATCQQGALMYAMALRNLKFEPGIYERRRTPINVLNLRFVVDLTTMISSRGRWLVVLGGSLFFLITLSFLPHRGESVAVKGWRAGKKLLSSHEALEAIYHEETLSPLLPTPMNPDLYDTLPHHSDSPVESDIYDIPPHQDSPMESNLYVPVPHHDDFPETSDLYEPIPNYPDPPSHLPIESFIDHAETELSNNSTADNFRLLIGIMSPFWASARRQIIRNAYRRFPQNLPVDIMFVEGNLTAPNNEDRVQSMQRTVVEWENSTYGDIMHLDCIENLNNGKTYEFLKKVGHDFGRKYTHVMKTDDDAFVNIPGLTQK